jgi:3-oxoadipate enol-lactonase
VAYDDVGTGEPIVLIHAFPLDARMWQPQRDALAGSHRVITPDLRGFGRSTATPPPRTIDAHADDVAALLDHLVIPCATVLGLSMGGYVALALARRHRARLARLVLADTRAAADTAEGRAARDRNIALVESQGVAAMLDGMLPRLVSPDAPADVVATVRAIGASQSPVGITAALAALRDRPDATKDLASLALPVLVLVGREDTLTPPAEARALADAIPSATLVEIPGAGHLANLEAPAPFNRALLDFLAR